MAQYILFLEICLVLYWYMCTRVGWKWSSSRIQLCSPKIGCKSQKQALFSPTTFFCIALILPNSQKTCFLFQWDFSTTQKLNDPKYWISHMKNNGLEHTVTEWPQKNYPSSVAWDISKKVAEYGSLVWMATFWQFFVNISGYSTRIIFSLPPF